jgi:hypothetical protein
MKKNNLKKLLEMVLEEEIVSSLQQNNIQSFTDPVVAKNVSVDQAIDRYIIRYEKESIPMADTYDKQIVVQQNLLENFITKVLTEQEELDGTSSTESNSIIQDENTNSSEEPIINTPQINLQDFTRSIARLVNNFDALINPKDIIINRTAEYIKNNYDEKTSKEFLDILSQNYNITTYDKLQQKQDEMPTEYSAGSLSFEG